MIVIIQAQTLQEVEDQANELSLLASDCGGVSLGTQLQSSRDGYIWPMDVQNVPRVVVERFREKHPLHPSLMPTKTMTVMLRGFRHHPLLTDDPSRMDAKIVLETKQEFPGFIEFVNGSVSSWVDVNDVREAISKLLD